MKIIYKILLGFLFITGSPFHLNAADKLKIGVTAGPHIDILQDLKERASKKDLELEFIEFNDFILPNIALAEGEIDLNIYQHRPFLESQKATRGFDFTDFGKTILLPMGVYSLKYKSLDDVPRTGKVAIPNDPTNGGRALLVLQDLGILKLKEGVGSEAMVTDIIENPKHLKIVEVEAPQLPRSLEDVDIAVINTDWVLVAGLDPSTALARENKDSPYTNIIVVRTKDKNRKALKTFKKLYQSEPTKTFIEKRFKGAVLAAWEVKTPPSE
tara:strand:+ start:1197 stop:2006 length:810 start_codon:yes stop_codon:yes gene_type:complete